MGQALRRHISFFFAVAGIFSLLVSCSSDSSDDTKVQAEVQLSGLTLSSGTLTPAFSSSVVSYTASVANSVVSVTVTPAVADSSLSVSIDGAAIIPGAGLASVALTAGAAKTVSVVVSRGSTSKTYTVAVTRTGAPAIQVSGDLNFGDGSPITYVSGTSSVDFEMISSTGTYKEIVMTIANVGTADLTLSGASPYINISGTNADHFAISTPPSDAVIPKNTTKNFTVRFTMLGTGYGTKNATLAVGSDDPAGAFVLALTGSTC